MTFVVRGDKNFHESGLVVATALRRLEKAGPLQGYFVMRIFMRKLHLRAILRDRFVVVVYVGL
jgi:hypothetical protein